MYASQFPHTVGKLILLDVAMAGLEQKLDKETLIKAAYMMYLSICFIVSRVSTILALIMVKLYPWSLIGPFPYEVSVVHVYVCTGVLFNKSIIHNTCTSLHTMCTQTEVPFTDDNVKVHMTYMYMNFLKWLYEKPDERKMLLADESNKVPTLFLYGGRKRVMFHSDAYLKKLDQQPDCGYKQFENHGHLLHWTASDDAGKEIKQFLDRK